MLGGAEEDKVEMYYSQRGLFSQGQVLNCLVLH